MLPDPYVLDEAGRAVVLVAIQRHCARRGWNLLAAHVRSNHVHAVVEESYASRELNQLESDGPDRKRWARHGSTRWLWKDEEVRQALRYGP
jgi:REP element-mobilizing transposase RayT